MPAAAVSAEPAPYVLILAGGSGERFWPLSRRTRPKQLLRLVSARTLLEETLDRLAGLTSPERILVLTNQDQEAAVRELLGDRLPADQIVAEPAKRDTAAAIALAVGWVARQDPAAMMVVLPADHVIRDAPTFRRTLQSAVRAAAAAPGALVTIGVTPTWACPSYGYIELGEPAGPPGPTGATVYAVRRFREKPAPELAQTFLEQGHFRWNAGMFVWSVPAIRAEFARQTPALATFVDQLARAKDLRAELPESFPHLPKISVDYAVMERAAQVLCLEAAFDWDDVGTWTAVANYLPRDAADNAIQGRTVLLEAHGNIVFSEAGKTIALYGVSDLIVVQTEDATLVCHRQEAEKIKQLVGHLPAELR